MKKLIKSLFPLILVAVGMAFIFIGCYGFLTHTAFGRPQPPVLREVAADTFPTESDLDLEELARMSAAVSRIAGGRIWRNGSWITNGSDYPSYQPDWSEEIAQAFYAGPKTAFCEITNEIASTTNLDQGWKSKRLGGVTVEEEPLWTETVKVFAKKSLVYQKHKFEIESHLISITNRMFTQEIVTNRNYLP